MIGPHRVCNDCTRKAEAFWARQVRRLDHNGALQRRATATSWQCRLQPCRQHPRSRVSTKRNCAAAGYVRGMMGISFSAWDETQELMGAETAAVTVACILQRSGKIKSPDGYLAALAGKVALGEFSPGPMVMAVLNGSGRVAA
ncbi:hypothetical protein HW561_00040 [Rhodobacteraceae bacterium B1Z28]|uniref:Plasmid replication protein C C-terminal domain-containing protein n=1 Tax=Ruegeria haliotis TaxID=2747601 RepID=A0ABX2PJ87_9RHOB|nr:replication initiation protein RepC [Ruegeria haliotis]NVO54180.1 hypothetical protein [Ruegeria haliotis]